MVDGLDNTVEEVTYSDRAPWADAADGGGSSLELLDPGQDNAVASAWAQSCSTE